jgi:hypothetical protein
MLCSVAEALVQAFMPIVEAMDKKSKEIGAPLFQFVVGFNVWGEDVREGTERRKALDACLDATAYLVRLVLASKASLI